MTRPEVIDQAVVAVRAAADHYRERATVLHAECVRLQAELTDAQAGVEAAHRTACAHDDLADALLAR